jgi:hypothetical protein
MKWVNVFLVLFFAACTLGGDEVPFNKNTWNNTFNKRLNEETVYREMGDVSEIVYDGIMNEFNALWGLEGEPQTSVIPHVRVYEIGEWDMDADQQRVLLRLGLVGKFPIHVSVIIRNDADAVTPNQFYPIYYDPNGTGAEGGFSLNLNSGNDQITLFRITGGNFDNANFDTTNYNRGWVIIWYIE